MQVKVASKTPNNRVVSLQLDADPTVKDLNDWLRYIQLLHYRTMDLSLDRIQTVIERIFTDEVPFRVISIAGTNGKGSVATMLESIFRHAGYSTGLYTSPHLVDFNERFVVNGQPITNGDLLNQFQRVEAVRDQVPLTYFEFGTAIAVDYFIQQQVDVAIFEVGLGGRKDAVNVMDADIACITSIGIDHEQWLGNTREQIGYEKAGILRPEQLAVCTDTELPKTVRNVAAELCSKLHVYDEDFKISSQLHGGWSLQLHLEDTTIQLDNIPKPPICGTSQRQNAAGAVAVALLARKYFNISDTAIRTGLKSTQLAGRLQVVQQSPEILLDVAHNIESVCELQAHLSEHPVPGRTLALMSVLSEKPIERMVECIKPIVDEWHLCGIHDERGLTARQLHRRVQPVLGDQTQIELHYDVNQGFNTIVERAEQLDRVVVFGSFLTVGAVIQDIRRRISEQT